jgi:hypothetical protein
MKDLPVAVVVFGIVWLVADDEFAAAGAEHASIRKQHGCSVVTTIHILSGKLLPFVRRRIPQFGDVDRRARR